MSSLLLLGRSSIVSTLVVLMGVLCWTTVHASDDCTLDCPSFAPCTIGKANFADHTVVELGTDNENNMHCQCPIGLTGLYCDVVYESCDNQPGHTCYHGGSCVPGLEDKYGNEQLFCDCSSAEKDGVEYVGKFCETKKTHICNTGADEDDQVFCVNGGECNPSYPNTSSQPCLCSDGWEGEHCEFKQGHVPECTLDCENGGTCVIGVSDPTEAEHLNHIWSLEEVDEHMRCKCPPGFGGHRCQSSAEQCGDSICLHGGTCVTTKQTTGDGNVRTQHHCDCTSASDSEGNFYAGKYCEHKQSVVCSDDDWNLFCVQGGTCKENPIEGCTCPKGTAGYKCEFIIDNFADDVVEDDNNNNNNNNNDNNDDVKNPEDEPPTRCGEGYCINGGVCTVEPVTLEDGTQGTVESCDCSQAFTDEAVYAGEFCQYKSTTLCYSEEDGFPDSLEGVDFCLHHGSCQDDGSCDCPRGFTGRHCEKATLEINESIESNEERCGDTICYNGGVCAETEVIGPDNSLQVTLHCDCSSAFDSHYLYAGTSCQFPSTSLCTAPQAGQSLQGSLFCTNHGECMDNPQLGCTCPDGFYGFSCEFERHDNDFDEDGIPDEEDSDVDNIDWEVCGDDGLVCHNGGRCVTTVVQNEDIGDTETEYSCDCSTARVGETAYLGQQCEFPQTSECDAGFFCVNHGTCKQDIGCDCPDGFTGTFCQLKSEKEDVVIVVDGEDPVDYEECGEDLLCLNGGRCVTTIVQDKNGNTKELQHCDCSTAFNDEAIFAGLSCEFKATSLCTTPQADSSMEGVYFCTNGGECRENHLEGCKCDAAWQGFHCEYATETEQLPNDDSDTTGDEGFGCHLNCMNGGICANGAKDLGLLHDKIADVSHLNQTYDEDSFAHCVCPEGWVGLTCEHRLEICGDDEHVCLHGSTCIVDENGNHACDCSQADELVGENDKPLFAGDSCQYTGTDICTIGEDYPGKPLFFCVNGGRCNAQVSGGQPDPGCSCPSGFSGPHCEESVYASASATRQNGSNVIGMSVGIAVGALVGVLMAFVVGSRVVRRGSKSAIVSDNSSSGTPFPRRRRRRAGNATGANNLVPPGRNRSTPFDLSPSSDPIATGLALAPDEEPEPFEEDGIMKDKSKQQEPLSEDTVMVDGDHLDSVDFV